MNTANDIVALVMTIVTGSLLSFVGAIKTFIELFNN
jgi:hypothetical protein